MRAQLAQSLIKLVVERGAEKVGNVSRVGFIDQMLLRAEQVHEIAQLVGPIVGRHACKRPDVEDREHAAVKDVRSDCSGTSQKPSEALRACRDTLLVGPFVAVSYADQSVAR